MRIFDKVGWTMVGVLCLAGLFCAGVVYGQTTFEPKVIREVHNYYQRVEVPVEKIEYVHVVEERVETVTVEIPMELRYFESTKELKQWLKEDDTDHVLHLSLELIDFTEMSDCDDYARQLMKSAIDDGYYMSTQFLPSGFRDPVTGKLYSKHHLLNCAIVGNDIYFIEPQSDNYWKVCEVD